MSKYIHSAISVLLVCLGWTVLAQEGELKELNCYECHDVELDAFSSSSHHTLILESGTMDLEASCTACHGDSEAHEDDPSLDNIITADRMAERCLTCHAEAGRSPLLSMGSHSESHADNCMDCHNAGHNTPAAEPLLRQKVNALCGSCHATERAEFELPFAHKDIDGPMACTSCHDIHNQQRLHALRGFGDQHLCTSCHEEKTGPYLFPHDVNEVDACLACHRPHGSTTAYLLARPSTTQLCMECHTDFFSVHRDPTLGQQSCTQCHSEIHGSQRDPLLFQP